MGQEVCIFVVVLRWFRNLERIGNPTPKIIASSLFSHCRSVWEIVLSHR